RDWSSDVCSSDLSSIPIIGIAMEVFYQDGSWAQPVRIVMHCLSRIPLVSPRPTFTAICWVQSILRDSLLALSSFSSKKLSRKMFQLQSSITLRLSSFTGALQRIQMFPQACR